MRTAPARMAACRARAVLLATTAFLALPSIADAQDVAGPPMSVRTRYEPQIVIAEPGTPSTALDPVDVNGVGQMVIDERNGFIGLCTGTLINPRTVILAAHCVNENPAGTGFQDPWGYGAAQGGLPISFGFAADNRPALSRWLNAGVDRYRTVASSFLYNVNQVAYNPASTRLGIDYNFLQGDVAVATLDTPAANVPSWAILLSALPAPASIDPAAGTGYHVVEQGYGTNGVGTTGAVGGIDYRRRAAENYIGLLGSLDDLDLFLFGARDGLPQNLYQLDFDDPRRGTAAASPFDLNIFKDDALPREGITGPGDSGGPLILDDSFSKQLVIAVLSGGDRFFDAQVSGSYGTTSFYQPLYLFWDYIAANNPYHYVGAKAGDAHWTDPTHWVSKLDPAYQVIVDGQLVNGVPTAPGDGIDGTTGKFGQLCIQAGGATACQDVASGASANAAAALPAATIANGLPGATDFVPMNNDPVASTHTRANYYDVTLSEAGTTTLGTATTIDRLTISGAGARLAVAAGGSLTSLIGISQLTGAVRNDGVVTTPGDYLLLAGGLSGTGRIDAPFFTSVTGMIAPGTLGGIGTLTFGGNVILASGNRLLIDIGPNGTSDRVAVVGTGIAGSGMASVGGSVGFAPVAGYRIRFDELYTIVTAQGGVTGTFATLSAISPILRPAFIYTANAVQARITAGTYASVVADTPVQAAFAGLLDRNRATNYAVLGAVYGILDLQSVSTIRSNLEALAPRTETLVRALGTTALDTMGRFYRDRLAAMDVRGGLGGAIALIGKPVEVASVLASDMPGGERMGSDTGGTTLREGALPDDMSGFVAGGYLNGDSSPMPTALPAGGRDRFDGWYAAAGIEKAIDGNAAIGLALSYVRSDGDTAVGGQRARGELFQGTLYGKLELATGIALDTQFSAGLFTARTDRTVALATTMFHLKSRDDALALSGEVGLGRMFDLGTLKIGPRLSGRFSHVGFTPTAESGGGPAMVFDRGDVVGAQGRAGLVLSGGVRLRPYASAYYVHDFADRPGVFGANFAAGAGSPALFALAGRDKDWGEVSAGVAFGNDKVALSLGADTSFLREDVENQSYRGSVTVRF